MPREPPRRLFITKMVDTGIGYRPAGSKVDVAIAKRTLRPLAGG